MNSIDRDAVLGILGKYVRFQNTNSNSTNLAVYCPFHKDGQETTPSMYVYVGPSSATKQVGAAFCHTCNEGWSLTSLLKKLRVPFAVIDEVKAQIGTADFTKKEVKHSALFPKQTMLPEALLGLYQYIPRQMLELGFPLDLVKEYEIGFDRKAKRIIFPIRDHHGNLVGLSGRTVVGAFPPYKIYKEELASITANYSLDKSTILWGLDKFYTTRMHITSDIPVVVCEGFKAALWVIRSGYPHTVAVMGSYVSPTQNVLLSRIANEVVLFLDNDAPGIKATLKSLRYVRGVDIRVARYPRKDDSPDDLTIKEVRTAIETATTPREWRKTKWQVTQTTKAST